MVTFGEPRVERGIVYAEVDGAPVLMDLYVPAAPHAGPYPWLVRFSSGVEKPDSLADALLDKGYALAYASYNATNQSGVYPPYPQLHRLVQRGVRFLRARAGDYNLDPVKAGAWGWSRGGSAAATLAATGWTDRFTDDAYSNHSPRVAACIAIAGSFGFVPGDRNGNDLRTWAGGDEASPDAETDRLKQVRTWVTPRMPPTLLLRGGDDGSARDAELFRDALQRLQIPADLYVKPKAGHGLSGADVAERIVRWADTYVRSAEEGYLRVPVDLENMALALAEIGQFDAAGQVREEARRTGRWPETLDQRIETAEGTQLAERVRARMAAQTSRVAYREDLDRLENLAAKHADLGALLAPLAAADAERRERVDQQAAALRVVTAKAEGREWPNDIPRPHWPCAGGVDAIGPWAMVGVEGGGDRVSVRLRWCPPGEAELGGTDNDWGYTVPEPLRRPVRITNGFWLAETEVTQAFFERVMGSNPSHFKGRPDCPVEKVNYERAEAFVAKLNETVPGLKARLPLVAEWQWACRAGGRHRGTFAGTDDLDPMGWYAGNSGGTTQPVASKLPNAWGLYDMQGNVWEWCADPAPAKPTHYRYYVGGAFCSSAERCRPEMVGFHNKSNTTWYHGLRIAVPGIRTD